MKENKYRRQRKKKKKKEERACHKQKCVSIVWPANRSVGRLLSTKLTTQCVHVPLLFIVSRVSKMNEELLKREMREKNERNERNLEQVKEFLHKDIRTDVRCHQSIMILSFSAPLRKN